MATRAKLRRLQRMIRGNLEGIEQRDGSIAYFDLEKAVWDVFLYFLDSLHADCDRVPRPAPPPVLKAVANAINRRDAYKRVMGGYTHIPIDPEALIEEGRFD